MLASSKNVAEIWHQYQTIKTQQPAKYARDIASEMGLSEAELTHARLGHDAIRLTSDMAGIIAALESVGEIKSLCRNDWAVHEQIGRFTHQHLGEHAGLVLNPRALDLRLFMQQWASAFYLREQSPRGERQSIQFFDHQGDALLKVYTTANTDSAAWEALIARFRNASDLPLTLLAAPVQQHAPSADAREVDQAWRAMTDVHQFFGLLKTFRLSRQQAFRLVGDDLAYLVSNDALPRLLDTVLQDGNEIMIFVGNRGCVQIFTGVIETLKPMQGWINIFNQQFTLHLRQAAIHESWITRKPTADGYVTSLELFAADGSQIAQLYGQRSEGDAEQQQWRMQTDALANKGKAA
ncbi:ChuX/HutX family heme-like substrate-binding protein [Kosakonia sp.]|uniref:hemin-degrading factor n=1 Tax=Kosakonia sp. TaxID=1916651 RepID=UPI002898CE4D|nr:ChuX/HutX family heme-like substrate-binding protein [Kosakonia sp.]